jgi:hypothetical protein
MTIRSMLSRWAAVSLCCTLATCKTQSWNWYIADTSTRALALPATRPDAVEVFWPGDTPAYSYDVINTFSFTDERKEDLQLTRADHAYVEAQVRKYAASRGASVVLLQKEAYLRQPFAHMIQLDGVIGRRSDGNRHHPLTRERSIPSDGANEH